VVPPAQLSSAGGVFLLRLSGPSNVGWETRLTCDVPQRLSIGCLGV